MNKNIFYTLLIALLACSCNFLDEEIFSSIDGENMYKTAEQADLAVAGIYSNLSSNKGYNRLWQGLTTYGTDEARCYMTGKLNDNFFRVSNFSHTTSDSHINNLYSNLFNGIALCNDAANKIGQMEVLEQEKKNALIAEARFLRGFFYFNLVQLWGPVRLSTDTPSFGSIMSRDFSRAEVPEVYRQIIEDLSFAEEHLPGKSERGQTGRATHIAATGMLAKVYLTIGSGSRFGVDGYEDYNYDDYYALAKEKAAAVMGNDEGYDLAKYFPEIFDWNNKYNSEIIFDANFAIGGQGNQWPKMGGAEGTGTYPYYKCGWAGRAYLRPTAYLSLCVFGHDKLSLKADGSISGFKTSDIRFTQSIATSSISNNTGRPGTALKANVTNWTAYKFNLRADTHDGYTWQSTPMNHPILRYSDILLIYAESALMLDLGDISGYEAWNRVRNRAKAEGTDPDYLRDLTPASFQDVHAMMDEMLDERMREFCFEGIRRFDLYRTGRFQREYDRMEERLEALAAELGNEQFRSTILPCDIEYQAIRTNLKPYHNLFPIPQSEMNIVSSTDYRQNPGWQPSTETESAE